MKYIGNAFHCRRRVLNRVKCLAAVAVLLALCASQAGASGIIYQFNNVFSGSSLSQPAPWLDATFQDVNGGVELTISNASLTSGEFVSGFYFNLNTNLNPSSLDFTLLDKSAGVSTPTISQGANQFKADGDGYYDVLFSFGTGHSGRFGAGDSISFFICGITNLNAYDFTFLSSAGGGKGPFYSAAHIQGIPGNESAWVNPTEFLTLPVPEPASTALATLGLGLWAGYRCLRSRSRK